MITIRHLCETYHIEERFVHRLIDHGLLSPLDDSEGLFFAEDTELRLGVIVKAAHLGFSLQEIDHLLAKRHFDRNGAYG